MDQDLVKEYDTFCEKLKKIIPFEAYPSRELVVLLRGEMKITLKSKLRINGVHNSKEITGIICSMEMDDDEVLACALTHLMIPLTNPLCKEITQYQIKRIKLLKKLNREV